MRHKVETLLDIESASISEAVGNRPKRIEEYRGLPLLCTRLNGEPR